MTVTAEKIDSLPLFNPNAGGWAKGAQLRGVRAQETTTPNLLDPESLVLRAGPASRIPRSAPGPGLRGRPGLGHHRPLSPTGAIKEGQPVYASYRHAQLRIDSVVLTRGGRIVLRQGESRPAAPLPPELKPGERRLANIWLPGRLSRLGPEHLFPVLETAYPEPPKPKPAPAEQLLPRTMSKLQSGERLRILAWGDSVTVGTYLPDWERNRWQEQFVARLKERFPQANIELLTEAWGGRNTASYLAEPPGSAHNYQEKVLATKPDLIVSEFVNDAGLSSAAGQRALREAAGGFPGHRRRVDHPHAALCPAGLDGPEPRAGRRRRPAPLRRRPAPVRRRATRSPWPTPPAATAGSGGRAFLTARSCSTPSTTPTPAA